MKNVSGDGLAQKGAAVQTTPAAQFPAESRAGLLQFQALYWAMPLASHLEGVAYWRAAKVLTR